MSGKREARQRKFINRELSWLEFNQRILDLSADEAVPLLERGRFLAITASNLDEFFMVRVGGLQTLVAEGVTWRDPSGMTPRQQLDAVMERALAMVERQSECHAALEQRLAAQNIRRLRESDLSDDQREHCQTVFDREISPVLSAVACGGPRPLPLLGNRVLYLGVRLKDDHPPAAPGKSPVPRLAVLALGRPLPRMVTLPGPGGYEYILLEDLVAMFAGQLFPGEQIDECAAIRITRNADMSVREDMASDLLSEMSSVLDNRKRSACVRLEVDARARAGFVSAFARLLGVSRDFVVRARCPVDLSCMSGLCELKGFDSLLNEQWSPQVVAELAVAPNMLDMVSRHDLLLYHPFDSFDPVVRFVQHAAADPDVVAIKQVLYRTSRQSPITAALMLAAQAGKYVTVLIELKARFDEARNIEWAQELEDAGVQVVYGVRNLKTHAKICLVIRREGGVLKRYMHFGTGNYNETTARLYTDVSYMTADEDLGLDASAFFNAITGYSQPQKYLKIEAAPIGLRDLLIAQIEAESARARQGQPAWIKAKINSLSDQKVIRALYDASQAGVKISLNVRGICCLRPGVAGQSENIRVVSVVDRFLEHSRIVCFGGGGTPRVYVSSADWMSRNLEKRIELIVPVSESKCRDRLLAIVDTCLADTVNAWVLTSDGTYERLSPAGAKDGCGARKNSGDWRGWQSKRRGTHDRPCSSLIARRKCSLRHGTSRKAVRSVRRSPCARARYRRGWGGA